MVSNGGNGPGEARDADIGLAAGKGKDVIFRKGEIIRRVDEADMFDALKAEIDALIQERATDVELVSIS